MGSWAFACETDEVDELGACAIELGGRLVVGETPCESIEFLEADARFEKAGGLWQRLEFVVGRHHVGVGIELLDLALRVGAGTCEEARAVEVQVRRELLSGEGIDGLGVVTGDVLVA